ncbi:hypothetical protein LCGC14_1275640, partial [marine sediment metagenome]
MARAPDAPQQVAGKVSPQAQQSVQRGKEALMQAITSSEQQRGATTRTAMQIGGQERMQQEQQAFQAEQADKDREARIVGAEEDRRHQEKVMNLQDSLATKRMELENEFTIKGEERAVERQDEQEKKLMALWKAEKRWDAHMSQERGKAAIGLARLNAKQRSDMTKLGLTHLKQAEDRQKQREMNEQLSSGLEDRLGEGFKQMLDKQGSLARFVAGEESFDPLVDQELKNQAVNSVTVGDIRSSSKPILENRISSK